MLLHRKKENPLEDARRLIEVAKKDVVLSKIAAVAPECLYSVDRIAECLDISSGHLYRLINDRTGLSPREFIRDLRSVRAWQLLQNSNMGIAQIAYELGYSDSAHFSSAFKKIFHFPPSVVRNGYLYRTNSEQIPKIIK